MVRNAITGRLGVVEHAVMEQVWVQGPQTADACRAALERTHPMHDSTMRTVLRRLEQKGYLAHSTEGRTFVYRAAVPRGRAGVRAAKQVIDRFWGGSAEDLVLGLVDHDVLDGPQLERLQKRIAAARRRQP